MEVSLIEQGIQLMFVGMGTVFIFLTILVFAMKLLFRLVTLIQPPVASADIADDELAAISAAINYFENDK